jgi:hypothetical protein
MTPLEAAIDYRRRGWRVVPVPSGEKGPRLPQWQKLDLRIEDLPQHFGAGVNVGVRLDNLVDLDLDCPEALALADLYLPATEAVFGRQSKPRSHLLYSAADAKFEAFADPIAPPKIKSTLLEIRTNSGHQTIFPPSIADGERREWQGNEIAPRVISFTSLRYATAWLATACLVMRYVNPTAARRPGPDLPAILWEWDHDLARPVYGWLGLTTPDAPRRYPRRRTEQNARDLDLAEIVHAIPNNCGWEEWNNVGLAIFAASKDRGDGFVIFDDFSAKSGKYDPHETAARWKGYGRSPPSRTGPGKLAKLAYAAGWRPSPKKEER